MNKFAALLVVAAGMCGSAGAATTPPTMSNTSAAGYATGYATCTTNNVLYQVDQLKAEVQALKGQVQALQNMNSAQSNDSVAELATVGVGG